MLAWLDAVGWDLLLLRNPDNKFGVLKKPGCFRLVKNDEMQGAQIPRNEAYIEYVAVTRDEAQHRGSRFSTA